MVTTPSIAAGTERQIREMLMSIVHSLVDHPDEAEIVLLNHPDGSTFRVHVHPADMARLIGNQGKTVNALRCIVGASGRKLGRHMTLDIIEEAGRLQ